MTTTTSLYGTCERLFADYPLAVSTDDVGQAMILMVEDGGEPAFFSLDSYSGRAGYTLRWWCGPVFAEIEHGSEPPATGEVADILTQSVPLPSDGSLWAWRSRGAVTTLIAIRAHYTPETPVPTWMPMPREGTPDSSWAPHIGERFGAWFWDHYRNGGIVNAGPLVAATPGAVFWASPRSLTIGTGCCVVARDVTSPAGWTLPQGAYVYFESLQAGESAGPLDEVLAGDVTDLAPRFRKAA